METSPEIILGNLKQEERYKRLERNLNLALVNEIKQMKTNGNNSWPSVSTIHSEGPDTTSANGRLNLQISRVESDVVSSSTNLRKVFALQNRGVEQISMVTSSVKKFPIQDRPLMPPPLTYKQKNTKKPSNINSNYNIQNEHDKKQESHSISNTYQRITQPSTVAENNIQDSLSNSDCKGYRLFFRWRVLLNNQGQLIIKGTLECGKIARSKPISHRLTSNKVQSMYKHIYFLNGNINDEKHELPEYVRGKFYNGFPDDWENVYQLWKNYILEGCKLSFRWPTRITDSDDDLNSEITDFTFSQNKEIESQEQPHKNTSKNVFNNHLSVDYNTKLMSEKQQKIDDSNTIEINYASPQNHTVNKKLEDSEHFSEKKNINTSNTECNNTKNINNVNNNSSKSSVKNASYLYEIIQEDKLRIILSNLGDKNCPPDYLDKFIELIECLKYILSYTPNPDYEENNKKQTEGCHKCNNKSSFSKSKETIKEIQNDVPIVNKERKEIKEHSEQAENYENSQFLDTDNDIENLSSNSDGYMGIPKINLNHLLISKVRKRPRYKDIKNRNKNKNTTTADQLQEQNTSAQIQKLHNDSFITISELEYKNCAEKCQQYKKQRLNHDANINADHFKTSKSIAQIANYNITQNTTNNKKPVIKNCEPAYFDLRSINRVQHHKSISDISTNDNGTSEPKEILSHNNINENKIICENAIDEKLHEEILKHPFLTYDSEDFENDEEINMHLKSQTKNRNSHIRNETDLPNLSPKEKMNNNMTYHNTFGSKENPKLLMSWVPFIHLDNQNKYNLKFKGKLLNEAGHVLHRKFITNSVHQRHSLKLIETVNNEYFLLVGEFTNKNHIVPKELLKQCSAGCPLKINEFCQEWIKLRSVTTQATNDNKSTNLSNTSLKDITVSTSSRGRRIVPPLNYWHGERLLTKNFDTVYHQGTLPQASFVKKSDELKKSTMIQKHSIKNDQNDTNENSPKKRFRSDNMSSSPVTKQSIKRRILKETSSSNSDFNNSDNEYHPSSSRPIQRVNEYTRKLRARNQNQRNAEKSRVYNTRTKSTRDSVRNPSSIVWSFGKAEYNDVLSDDLASLR